MVVTLAAAERRPADLDPSWPPVLIVFVVAVLGAIAVMIVLFVRSVRAAGRGRAGDGGGPR